MLAARVKIANNHAFYKQLYDDIASEASTAAQRAFNAAKLQVGM